MNTIEYADIGRNMRDIPSFQRFLERERSRETGAVGDRRDNTRRLAELLRMEEVDCMRARLAAAAR